MLNKLKTYLTLASLLFALLSGIYGIYKDALADREKLRADNLQDELVVKTTENISYEDELGRTHTITIEYEKTIEQMKNSIDSVEIALYNSYKSSKLKDKQINSMTAIIATGYQTSNYTSIDTVYNDTVYLGTIKKYEDDFINIVCTEDSITYIPTVKIDVFKSFRLIPRKIQPFKWLNSKWELTKLSDKEQVEIITNIPNSKVLVRQLKIK